MSRWAPFLLFFAGGAWAGGPAPAVSTQPARLLLGPGPDLQAEAALREAYVKLFEDDASDVVSSETASFLRSSTTPIELVQLKDTTQAEYSGGAVHLNLGWLLSRYGPDNSGSDEAGWDDARRRAVIETWLSDPEAVASFARRTAVLVAHEIGHAIYELNLGADDEPAESEQELMCRYREVLFLRARLRREPDFMDLEAYDALMREAFKEPPPAGPWWSDPLPRWLTERRAWDADYELRRRFPRRFEAFARREWYRQRLLDNGLPALRGHLLAELRPFSVDRARLGPLKAADRYGLYFERERARLEGLLAADLQTHPPAPIWNDHDAKIPAQQPPALRLDSVAGAPGSSIEGWDSLRGKAVVIFFWAPSCADCRDAIEPLNRLARAFRKRSVRFLALTEAPQADVDALLKTQPLQTWSAAGVPAATLDAFGVMGLPYVLLVDAKGNIVDYMDPEALTPQVLEDTLSHKKPKHRYISSLDLPPGMTP